MANPQNVERTWYVIDAEGQVLGRLASQVASMLRGKHKPTYAPHADCGDHVIIINGDKAVLTGKKLDQKSYKWHTGWIGHLKEIQYATLMQKNPEKAMQVAVNGMIPDTVIGRNERRRLHVYAGSEHPHAAQKPESYEL